MFRCVVLFSIAACSLGCGRIGFPSSPSAADGGPDSDVGLPDSGSGLDGSSDSGRPVDGGLDSGRDAATDAGDAATDAGDAATDGGTDGGPPPVLGPFGPPSLVAGVESPSGQDDPTLAGDELLIIFQRGPDLFGAERAVVTDPFGTPVLIAELSSGNPETTPELSSDGLTIYFSRDLGAGSDDEIFVSTRSSRSDPWDTPVLVAEFSSPLSEVAPTPTADANVLLFVRNFGAAAGREDIQRATRPSAGGMWTFVPLASPINTVDIDTAPSLGLSGTLYFSTDRAGGPREIWQAAPDVFGTGWLAPTPMTELNDTFGVTDPWISLDERRMYYVTNETGRDEIYVRSR